MTELVTVGAAALAALAVVRIARGNLALGLVAVSVGTAATIGPLDPLADRSLAAHMFQHVLLGDLAPLLLVVAVRQGDLRRLRLPRVAVACAGRVFRPLPAFLVWAAAIGIWHIPALYDLALEHEAVHGAEHVSFAVGGLLIWSQLLDPLRRGLLSGWRLFGYALGVLVAAQMLANVLVLSYRPLYPAYLEAHRLFGLSALGDQDAAAVVMMLEQLATIGTFAFLTARRLVLAEPSQTRRAAHPFAA